MMGWETAVLFVGEEGVEGEDGGQMTVDGGEDKALVNLYRDEVV